jgi:hypothetical protein
MDTNVLEKHTISIYSPEDGYQRFGEKNLLQSTTLKMDTNVAGKHTVSIYSPEDGYQCF